VQFFNNVLKNSVLVGQFIRFGLAGGLLTILIAAGYLFGVRVGGLDPSLSLLINFIIISSLGYVLHSRFSFKGHGDRSGNASTKRSLRFAATNIGGFLLNQAFVLVLVKLIHLPDWTPTLPIIFVTPLLTFWANRQWVFG
jgi:putative flippase GtrA